MKKDIHPKYGKATISCVCGYSFETKNSIGDLKIEICSNCHPFYTGKEKLIDTAGRVDKFNKKFKSFIPAEAEKTEE